MAAEHLTPWNVTYRVVELGADSRVITRQQLRDPAFYAVVKAGVLNGDITTLDQGADHLIMDGEPVPLTDARAVQALAASQEAWVGVPPEQRFLPGLAAEAARIAPPPAQVSQGE